MAGTVSTRTPPEAVRSAGRGAGRGGLVCVGPPPEGLEHVRRLSWDDIADLPTDITAAKAVVCVPTPASRLEQQTFLDLVREGPLATLRVIWLANSASVDACAALGVGSLGPPTPADGPIRSVLPGWIPAIEQVRAIAAPSGSVTPLASSDSDDPADAAVVAAALKARRWVITPEFSHLLVPFTEHPFVTRSSALLSAAVVLLAATMMVAFAVLTRADASEYRVAAAEVGGMNFTNGFPLPATPDFETEWSDPSTRMATRLLAREGASLVRAAAALSPGTALEQLAGGMEDELTGAAGFGTLIPVAFLAGDFATGARLLDSAVADPWGGTGLARLVTGVVWQRALESLHEGDFDTSRHYTRLFLHLSDRLSEDAGWEGSLEPQRNRTLARILEREFESGRALQLCHDLDVTGSFGRLVGGRGWGYRIPVAAAGLEERRAEHRTTYCSPPPARTVDYDDLASLRPEEHSLEGPRAGSPVCAIATLECEYLSLRDRILESYETTLSQDALDEVLEFSGRCTYLSDDLLFHAIADVDRRVALDLPSPTIRARRLAAGLRCFERGPADFQQIVASRLERLPCRAIEVGEPLIPDDRRVLSDVLQRCGSSTP